MIVVNGPAAVWRCQCCDLLFFTPLQPATVLLDQYALLDSELWSTESRPDWTLAHAAILQRMSAGSVLDIGCWTGGFLAGLPLPFERVGIEPSPWARAKAAIQGVSIAGKSLDDLESTSSKYDVVTIIDVLEHITTPLEFLGLAVERLEYGGIVVVSTGDSRALPWRLMPRSYWYYVTDHVCFFSERWFRWAAVQLDLEIEHVTRFSHFPTDIPWTPLVEFGKAYAYELVGGPRSLPVRAARRFKILEKRPETRHWRDHILIVLRKNLSGGACP
jgi:SAM-dependent methyltransferase